MRKDGKEPPQLDFWQPGMALVDFTNPAATKSGDSEKIVFII